MTGAPVIGLLGRGVPLELVEAVGARPRRLRGDAAVPRAEADGLLGTGIDPAARAVLATLLATRFAGLDGIVVANDSEAQLRLFHVLRELGRVDAAAGVPPLHLIDVTHLDRAASRAYTRAEFRELADVLTGWTGRTPDDLEGAIRRREAARTALATRRAELSGTRFLELRFALDDGPAAEALAAIGAAEAATPTGPRLILSGSGHDETAVSAAIEAAGATIVGDDHPDGELGLALTADRADLDGLADRYSADGPTVHRASPCERAEHLAVLVDDRAADGVLVYVRQLDDAPRWDVAAQRAAVDVPVVVVDGQDYGRIDADRLTAALAALGTGAAHV